MGYMIPGICLKTITVRRRNNDREETSMSVTTETGAVSEEGMLYYPLYFPVHLKFPRIKGLGKINLW